MGASEDWWAKKLANPQPTPRELPSAPPSQQPMSMFRQPPPVNAVVSKAQSANKTDLCPDCSSSNYYGFNGSKLRCYECGYPMEQSGSKYGSLTGALVQGDAKSSRGNDSRNNYNPQEIIGRVD
jgi:hypothetical protein